MWINIIQILTKSKLCGMFFQTFNSMNPLWDKARRHAFSSGGRACDLYPKEKLVILTTDQNSMLNKIDELLETCRHRRKHLFLSIVKKKDGVKTRNES